MKPLDLIYVWDISIDLFVRRHMLDSLNEIF